MKTTHKTIIACVAVALTACETTPKVPLTLEERIVRAEERKARAMMAMAVMQGVGTGLQAASVGLQAYAVTRPQPQPVYVQRQFFQPTRHEYPQPQMQRQITIRPPLYPGGPMRGTIN